MISQRKILPLAAAALFSATALAQTTVPTPTLGPQPATALIATTQVAATTAPADVPPPDRGPEEVRKGLATVLADVDWDRRPMMEAFDRIREIAGINVYVDLKALRSANVTSSDTATLAASQITVSKALTAILKPLGDANHKLTFDVIGKSLVISTESELKSLSRIYASDAYKLTDPAARKVLSKEVEVVEFDRTPLRDAIDSLSATTTQTIGFDWESLASAGVSRNTPITIHAKNLPLAQVLRLLLHDASATAALDFVWEGNKITIFVPENP